MNDRIILWSTAVFVLFFFTMGLLGLLGHFLVQAVLFIGFLAIVVNIVLITSKNDHKKEDV